MLRDVISQAVREWKDSPSRGDANALVQSLDLALSPLFPSQAPAVVATKRRRRA